ncbi:unnamed protein product [Rotaria sp. Silwood2]|nr:unnamed protein product [Rotaria sp. Silwood2]
MTDDDDDDDNDEESKCTATLKSALKQPSSTPTPSKQKLSVTSTKTETKQKTPNKQSTQTTKQETSTANANKSLNKIQLFINSIKESVNIPEMKELYPKATSIKMQKTNICFFLEYAFVSFAKEADCVTALNAHTHIGGEKVNVSYAFAQGELFPAKIKNKDVRPGFAFVTFPDDNSTVAAAIKLEPTLTLKNTQLKVSYQTKRAISTASE